MSYFFYYPIVTKTKIVAVIAAIVVGGGIAIWFGFFTSTQKSDLAESSSILQESLLRHQGKRVQAEVSFTAPIPETEYNEITSRYNLKVEYLEYVATKNITGGASIAVYPNFNFNQLKDDLKSRHDAEIIGIRLILAQGKADDFLRLIEDKSNNIATVDKVNPL